MPGTELVSPSSELLGFVASLKCRFSSFSSFLKDALTIWNCPIVTLYDLSSEGDLESGMKKGKMGHPAMWYSFTYIVRQLFPVDGFPFALKIPLARINNRVGRPPHQPRVYTSAFSDSFVDLGATKFRHRLKSISYGQKHGAQFATTFLPVIVLMAVLVPKLLNRQSRFRSSPHLTGDQLSHYVYPPEPRGEDFRKWILVMETLFPNRSAYVKAAKAQRAASTPCPGPKTGMLASARLRRPHTHLRYI